jgi:hypothetical protein
MIWTLLAILGVPVWLIAGGLGAVLWSRLHFRNQPGVFMAKIRLAEGEQAAVGTKWRTVYARRIHDVLLINKGVALMQVIPIGISDAESMERVADAAGVRFRGGVARAYRLHTDSKAAIEVAALDIRELQAFERDKRGSIENSEEGPA